MGDKISWHVKAARLVLPFAAMFSLAAFARRGDDYQTGVAASAAARAYFKSVPQNLESKKISRREPTAADGDGAYFTPDGSISIPPGAMIVFKNSGWCMDSRLPVPCGGEPMQFVDVEKLIPGRLRSIYDTLLERSANGDPKVKANNLQHLVWALRTAGTDDPIANNLSGSQIELLDECAGRRGAFLKYHEREKRKNARRERKTGSGGDSGRISVGGYSYDAADLRGEEGRRRIEQHMATLAEMGEKATETAESDFRYGEIEDGLYSDITCDGGLSFTAKILNASERRREFRAADFAAQVGNGQVAGSRRQRVTMCPPDEFMVVVGAAQEGVDIDRSLTAAEAEAETRRKVRGRSCGKRKAKTAEGHTRTAKERERRRRTRTETSTVVEELVPVTPVSPVSPVVIREPAVTNEIVRTVQVAEDVAVRVVSIEYDAKARKGVLALEIPSGSFRKANQHIRANFGNLVRKKSPAGDAAEIPAEARLEIESILINEDDRCEVRFAAKAREDGEI